MKVLLLTAALLSCTNVFPQAKKDIAFANRGHQQPAILELPYSAEVVQAFIDDYMGKKGRSKTGNAMEYTVYKSIKSSEETNQEDLYFKIRQSEKEEGACSLSLLPFKTRSQTKEQDKIEYISMEAAKAFLNQMIPELAQYDLEMQINLQKEALKNCEQSYASWLKEAHKLEIRRLEIQNELDMNIQEQERLRAERDKQSMKLAMLISKKKQ